MSKFIDIFYSLNFRLNITHLYITLYCIKQITVNPMICHIFMSKKTGDKKLTQKFNRETLCKMYKINRKEHKIFKKCRLIIISSQILFSEIFHVRDLSPMHDQKNWWQIGFGDKSEDTLRWLILLSQLFVYNRRKGQKLLEFDLFG